MGYQKKEKFQGQRTKHEHGQKNVLGDQASNHLLVKGQDLLSSCRSEKLIDKKKKNKVSPLWLSGFDAEQPSLLSTCCAPETPCKNVTKEDIVKRFRVRLHVAPVIVCKRTLVAFQIRCCAAAV